MSIASFSHIVAPDLIHSVASRGERTFIVTRFQYPDGDFVPLYLEEVGGVTILTDKGTTYFKASADGVNLDLPARQNLIKAVCSSLGVEFAGTAFRKVVSDPSTDMVALLQAITRISTLQLERTLPARTYLRQRVGMILRARVREIREVHEDYVYGDVDATGSFPVDYRIDNNSPRHIFTIPTIVKCNEVAATVQFLRSHRHDVPTLAIVSPDARLRLKDRGKLKEVVQNVVEGIDAHEDAIVDFSLAA